MSARRIGFLSAARRWWAFVALVTGAGGLVAYWYASGITPTYEAETQLVAESPTATPGADRAVAELVPTFAELVRRRSLLAATVEKLRLPISPTALRDDVRGEAGKDTRVFTIRVRAHDPGRAVALANGLAREVADFLSRPPGAGGRPGAAAPAVRVRVVELATVADRIRPRTGLSMEFGALAALFGALAFAIIFEARSSRVGDERDLARVTPSVLGSVDGGLLARRRRFRPLRARRRARAPDPYRALAARLAGGEAEREVRSILVLGADRGAGSGAVALNLVSALAQDGTRVVLADLGDELEVARHLTAPGPLRGLGRSRIGAVRDDGLVFERFPIELDPPFVLAFPRAPARPASLAQARSLVDRLLSGYDLLVLHAPSLGLSPSSLVWARAAQTTLVVARRRHTRRESVAGALESLELVQTNVAGAVLHESRRA